MPGLDPLSLISFGISALTGAGSIAQQADIQKRLNEYFKPGKPAGSLNPDESTDFSNFGYDFTTSPGALRNQADVRDVASRIPYGQLYLDQIQANEGARQRQIPYAEQAIQEIQNGALGTAARGAEEFVKDPTKLQGNVFDRLVGMAVDANRAAAATRARTIDQNVAATGMSSDARAAAQQENSAMESEQTDKARREAFLTSNDYVQRALQSAAAIGSEYNSQLTPALYTRGSLEQPVDFASLANLGGGYDMFRLQGQNEANSQASNTLMSLAGTAYQGGMGRLNSRLQADAMQPHGLEKWLGKSGAAGLTGGLTAGLVGPIGAGVGSVAAGGLGALGSALAPRPFTPYIPTFPY